MSNYHIVTGKNIEDLNTNIEEFLKKNPKYTPYSTVYRDNADCIPTEQLRYQSFVKYEKSKSKSHKRRKSHKNESKKKHKKHRTNKKHTKKNK